MPSGQGLRVQMTTHPQHWPPHYSTVSYMSGVTESSALPIEAVSTYSSSPPFTPEPLSSDESRFEMNDGPVSREEEPAGKHPNSQASQTAHQRTGSGDTERPPSGQHSHESTNENIEGTTTEEQDGEDSDPAEMIEEFDWNDLIERYHDAMNKCTDEEAHLMQEWSGLMDVRRHTAS